MIVGKTKSDVDKLWNAFWTGGITNPVTVIEQINYLLFCRRLDDIEQRNERVAERTKTVLTRRIFPADGQHLRWSNFKHLKASEMLEVVRDQVFPFLKTLGSSEEAVSTFSKSVSDASFLIPKASLLASAVELISGLDLDNSDTAGDLYEYLLSKLSTSGINGQFRTPRHIIRMMVEVMEPQKGERICDPACGTGGFLFSALQFILEKNTSEALVHVNEEGVKHGFVGDLLTKAERKKFDTDSFYGFDFDPTMLRVSAMNMWLHGIEQPHINYADSLSKNFTEENRYDLVLANPPFKGQLDYADCNPLLLSEIRTKKTELLFVLLILRILDVGGRAAVIIPDGVLFGSSNAHSGVRKLLIEDNQLEGVISMPSGFFKPYAGVSTGVLIFSKGGSTDRVWFYDMSSDGFSLDDRRQPVATNDIPDLLECWHNRTDKKFVELRESRLAELRLTIEPLKQKLVQVNKRINQLTFESVLSMDSKNRANSEALRTAQDEASEILSKIHPLQNDINQLTRNFWVTKEEIRKNKYDLSAGRYRIEEHDEPFYEAPDQTLKRLLELEKAVSKELESLLHSCS